MLGNFRPTDSRPGIGLVPRLPQPSSKPVMVLDDPDMVRVSWYSAAKRTFDILGGLLLGLVLVPVMIVAAIAIAITSPGPIFYTQTRLGRLGKPFVIWKLRTMRHRCEDQSGVQWSVKGDKRITFVGKILRRLHIDEFPQLFNVLKGDMSLVGPRPERPEFFPILEKSVPNYAKRLLVKPGVTGMAQVYLPPDEDVTSVRLKQIFDLHYIRSVGFWLDVRLMFATAVQAVGLPHLIVRPFLCLPRKQAIEQAGRLDYVVDEHRTHHS